MMSSCDGESLQPTQSHDATSPDLLDEQAEEHIRRVFHEGRWYFSVIDVIGVITESPRPRKYWTDMKQRIQDEGFREVSAKCGQLKMMASDGKYRFTDAADTETMLRIIQSIPSPRAEPIKQWLARVGAERLEEMENPALAIERARKQYEKLGYSDEWIERRLQIQAIRQNLTDTWNESGVTESKAFAALTDTIHEGTFDLTVGEHKTVKHLAARHNLRDSMTTLELLLTGLGEETARTLHEARDSVGFDALRQDCAEAGEVGGATRRDIEQRTGAPVVSPINHTQLRQERQREMQPALFADVPESEASEPSRQAEKEGISATN